MAVHAHLKNEFTENEKYHNLMRWVISSINSIDNDSSSYQNDPKFSDRQVWANSVDPD